MLFNFIVKIVRQIWLEYTSNIKTSRMCQNIKYYRPYLLIKNVKKSFRKLIYLNVHQ